MNQSMGEDEDFQPDNCPACAAKLKELEAEQGLRCRVCLDTFADKQWPFRSEDDESLCKSCERIVNARKSSEGARYGTRGTQR